MIRVSSYSVCLATAATGTLQRGFLHSVFNAAANIVFPSDLVLSLNAMCSPRMPNGVQVSVLAGAFPFSQLRAGMPVLFGAQRLHIEAVGCSLDLSHCPHWNPHIEHPEFLDRQIIEKNRERLASYVSDWPRATARARESGGLSAPAIYEAGCWQAHFSSIPHMAQYLCGRGAGLTPTGDDILAGWIAVNWLLQGPTPYFRGACQQILEVAKRQTHLLSQCWLSYAAEGALAEPIGALLAALTKENDVQLADATAAVLAMGATSGYDVIQGMLLGLNALR